MFLKREDQGTNHFGQFHQFVSNVSFLGFVDEMLLLGQGTQSDAPSDARLRFLKLIGKLVFRKRRPLDDVGGDLRCFLDEHANKSMVGFGLAMVAKCDNGVAEIHRFVIDAEAFKFKKRRCLVAF